MLDNVNSLGKYIVDDRVFSNRIYAMQYSNLINRPIRWDFRDEIFSVIDWTTPVEKELKTLYRDRAIQLREKYDYLSLFFSGGVDSANVLTTFVDNDIHLDEVVMYMPKALDSNATQLDLKRTNIDSEIIYAALPYLRNVLKNTNTKVRIIDVIEVTKRLLSNESLLAQYNNSIQSLSFHILPKLGMMTVDPDWNVLYESGVNVCHIHGADKPMVNYDYNNGYSFVFSDNMSWKFIASHETSLSESRRKHQFHEMFYWTGDLPELVIKQCQLVKQNAINDQSFMHALTSPKFIGYRNFEMLNPIVYDKKVLSIRDMFNTEKLGWETDVDEAPWDWINKTMSSHELSIIDNTMNNVKNSLTRQNFCARRYREFIVPFASRKYIL